MFIVITIMCVVEVVIITVLSCLMGLSDLKHLDEKESYIARKAVVCKVKKLSESTSQALHAQRR